MAIMSGFGLKIQIKIRLKPNKYNHGQLLFLKFSWR